MKTLLKQVIATVGVNKNNTEFTEDCFKNCVANINDTQLPISNSFDKKDIIGTMSNFIYKDGQILADITLFDEIFPKLTDLENIVRCAFKCDYKKIDGIIKVINAELVEGGWVDPEEDADRDLLK
jgi:hypothetical protein